METFYIFFSVIDIQCVFYTNCTSQFKPAAFQLFNSPLWLVATVWDSWWLLCIFTILKIAALKSGVERPKDSETRLYFPNPVILQDLWPQDLFEASQKSFLSQLPM